MSVPKRLVICVDGTWYKEDGVGGSPDRGYRTNMARINSVIKYGYVPSQGRTIRQHSIYLPGIGHDKKGLSRLKEGYDGQGCEERIKTVIEKCWENLKDAEDAELFLYGFSRGAYIVQAAACLLHHMGFPKNCTTKEEFDKFYENFLQMYILYRKKDTEKINTHNALKRRGPTIKFIGVFDTVQATNNKGLHDLTFVDSIQHMRHALALNENRFMMTPSISESPLESHTGRSIVQAWFLGTHSDMGGAMPKDGLSLYPLQWMLIESRKFGLVLDFDRKRNPELIDDPLELVSLTNWSSRNIENGPNVWTINYKNNFAVEMCSIESTHKREKYTPLINYTKPLLQQARKIFNENHALKNWTMEGSFRTIIHPSVFKELDQNETLAQDSRVRDMRFLIQSFRTLALADEATIPWIADPRWEETGASTFRLLVCGNAGSGKSTLINLVFGPDLTLVSTSRRSGVHDIDKALRPPRQRNLFIHDSEGCQAGDDGQLEALKTFLNKRGPQESPDERLHAIWYCIKSERGNRIQTADKDFLRIAAKNSDKVPLIIVGTKKDLLEGECERAEREARHQEINEAKKAKKLSGNSEPWERIKSEIRRGTQSRCQQQFNELEQDLKEILRSPPNSPPNTVFVDQGDAASIQALLLKTLGLLRDDRVRTFCVQIQACNLSSKIDAAVNACMDFGLRQWRAEILSPALDSDADSSTTLCKALSYAVLKAFGFDGITPEQVSLPIEFLCKKSAQNRGWISPNLKLPSIVSALSGGHGMLSMLAGHIAHGSCAIAPGLHLWAGAGYLSLLLTAKVTYFFASKELAVMVVACGCDVILILQRAFKRADPAIRSEIRVGVKEFSEAATEYIHSDQLKVHKEVAGLIPLQSYKLAVNYEEIRIGMLGIITKYSSRLAEDQGGPPRRREGLPQDGASLHQAVGGSTGRGQDSSRRGGSPRHRGSPQSGRPQGGRPQSGGPQGGGPQGGGPQGGRPQGGQPRSGGSPVGGPEGGASSSSTHRDPLPRETLRDKIRQSLRSTMSGLL